MFGKIVVLRLKLKMFWINQTAELDKQYLQNDSSWYLRVQSQQWKYHRNVLNPFTVNNNNVNDILLLT